MRVALAEEHELSSATQPGVINEPSLLVVMQPCLLLDPTRLDREANADLSAGALLACLLRPFSRVTQLLVPP